MKLLRKVISSTNFWPLLVITIFALLASRELVFKSGYFNMHDDLQMMRQLEMEKCFLDLQIPCRWVPDMGYGFGFPLFNYYPPLPYLIGQGIRLVGFSFVNTVKILFSLSFLVSGITMYFFAKEFFGKFGGLVSSVFYIWAPYHSVDVYVRGAMNEAWALAWFPLILWTGYRLIIDTKNSKRWIIGLALSWFALLTSHNLMTLIFGPLFALWCFIFILKEKKWNTIPHLIISGLLAFGFSAFFTLPAILEQKYVQVNTLVAGYYEYIAHFASINQLLFSRFWGYGASVWEEADKMSFQVGHIHWIASLVTTVLLIYKYFKTKKVDRVFLVVTLFVAVGWVSSFMAHSRSTPIWQAIPALKFVQFPWRFLAIVIFAFSFLAGSLVTFLGNRKTTYALMSLVVIGLVVYNWNYFRPEKVGPLTDEEKFSGAAWELQQTAGIFDYLPISANENPKEPNKTIAEILSGEGKIKDATQGTSWAKFNATIDSEEAVIRMGIYSYPIWRAKSDGNEVEIYLSEEEKWGRMYIRLPKGVHNVRFVLKNTPLRTISNLVSLATWSVFGFVLLRKKVVKFRSG